MSISLPAGVTLRVAGAGAARLAASVDADVVVAGPTGHPGLEPLIVVTAGDASRLVPRASDDDLAAVVDETSADSLPDAAALPSATVWSASHNDAPASHDDAPAGLPTPDEGPLSVGHRRVTARCGWADPTDADAYRELGVVAAEYEDGYESEPEDGDGVIDRVADAGLLGRGRTDDAGDEPLADCWETAREAAADSDGAPVVVVNANEVDDAVAGDRLLLESDPFAVLDGALAVAGAVDATDLVVYVGDTATDAAERATTAGAELAAALDDPPEVQVAAGPETFAAAEATMAIESLQGKERLEARRRPPGPAEWGLYGRPTLVHSPRTFAQVRALLAENPPDEPSSTLPPESLSTLPGTAADPGTRLVTVSGDVDAPATVELPTDAALSEALDAVRIREKTKAYRVGGRFGGIARHVDLPVGANALDGAGLGTAGGVELLGRSRCVLATVGETAAFAADGDCGRCVPCREGTEQLANLLRDVYGGEYDAGGIRELGRVMRTTSLCAYGVDAPRPVLTALSEFENEVAAHADGRCPAGVCEVGR